MQRDQMEDERTVTRRIFDELYYGDIQGDQMEFKSGVTRNIIDHIHSSHIQ